MIFWTNRSFNYIDLIQLIVFLFIIFLADSSICNDDCNSIGKVDTIYYQDRGIFGPLPEDGIGFQRTYSVCTVFGNLEPDDPLFLKDSLRTKSITFAVFNINPKQNRKCFIGEMLPNTKIALNSKSRLWIQIGNFFSRVKGNFIVHPPDGEAFPLSTFYVGVDHDTIRCIVSSGSVILSNHLGLKIIRANELGYYTSNKAPWIATKQSNKESALVKKVTELLDRFASRTEPIISKSDRIHRLVRTSRFGNINAGSSGPDIREPILDIGQDAFMGQLDIIIFPPF